jgi:hypothetical protein
VQGVCELVVGSLEGIGGTAIQVKVSRFVRAIGS